MDWGAHISPPPLYFSPEASEELVLDMTIVGYPLKDFFEVYNFFVAQNLKILENRPDFLTFSAKTHIRL